MDIGARVGIIPSEEFPSEIGPIYAEEQLNPLRELLNISFEEKRNFLIIPKLNPKINGTNKKSKRNIDPSNFTVISRNASKRGYIEKPKFSSSVPIPLLLSRDPSENVSEINTASVQITNVVKTPKPDLSTSSKKAVDKHEPVLAVEIEPFIKSVKKSQPDSDVENVKKNNTDTVQESTENRMQNLALLRDFMSKIKADPHQSIDISKFTLFSSDRVMKLPNKNCSTTAKVFCTDFTKSNKRVPKICFKYY